jgi:predicted kinase
MEKVHRPLSPNDQYLLDEYLATLEVCPHNTPSLFAVGFLGLPGSGKSTLADMLGQRLGVPVNRSDQIRRYLNSKGFPGAHPRPDIMAAMAEGRTRFFYANSTSAIIDANFAEYAAASRDNATYYGASLLLIRLVCPDDVALERLRHRVESSNTGSSAATAEDYPRIKALVDTFPPVHDPYAVMDTAANMQPQVNDLIIEMRKDGFIA